MSVLRAAFLTLLMLGLVLRPMGAALCEALTVDHDAPTHAHAHHLDHSHEAGDDDGSEDWHAHGEQVQADTGGAADLVPPFVFEPPRHAAVPVPRLAIPPVRAAPAPGPFRPPIG
jgi:hypothetical protein